MVSKETSGLEDIGNSVLFGFRLVMDSGQLQDFIFVVLASQGHIHFVSLHFSDQRFTDRGGERYFAFLRIDFFRENQVIGFFLAGDEVNMSLAGEDYEYEVLQLTTIHHQSETEKD